MEQRAIMTTPVAGQARQLISVSLALKLLEEVAAIGKDPAALIGALALPFSLDDLKSGRCNTLRWYEFTQLYRACILALSAHANREQNLAPMSKDEVDMLCYSIINCATLKEVIHRAARFCRMLGARASVLSLEIQDGVAVFHMATQRKRRSTSGLLTDLTGLSFYHRLFAWLIFEQIPVTEYCVASEEVLDREVLRFFQRPIQFGQSDNHFRFPARYLSKPVVRSYQSLVEILDIFSFDLVRDSLATGQFSEIIEQLIATRLARQESLPSFEQCASLFNISSATLRRRLGDEGSSFGEIKKRCRHQLALELLARQPVPKFSDIAARLGFSDVRAFRRAFQQWSGMSPQEYQQAVGDGAAGKSRVI